MVLYMYCFALLHFMINVLPTNKAFLALIINHPIHIHSVPFFFLLVYLRLVTFVARSHGVVTIRATSLCCSAV